MKKLVTISIFIVFYLNNFSQSNKIGLTTSPLAPSIGAYFISKPILQIGLNYTDISLYSSLEYTDYSKNANIKLIKFAIGTSVIIPNFLHFSSGKTQDIDIHLALSINQDSNLILNGYKELSLETGFTIQIINEIYGSFLIDPLNNHFKFGCAIGF